MAAMTKGLPGWYGRVLRFHTRERFSPVIYLPVEAGHVKKQKFVDIWNDSPVFKLRDHEFAGRQMRGMRILERSAKAAGHALSMSTGNYLAEEPYCIYQPKMARASQRVAKQNLRQILVLVQTGEKGLEPTDFRR